MQKRSSRLRGAAIGVLLAAGVGAEAQAKGGRHHHAEPAKGAESITQEKIESLIAAVSTLEGRLNDETAARQADEARAQAAEAQAAEAQADARAVRGELQAQIQTLPGEIKTDVAAAEPKPKPSWADTTKVGATVYADVSNISQTPRPNRINGTGIDIKRAYLIIDHQFSPIYSANLTIDFAPNGIVLNGAGINGSGFGTGAVQGAEVIKYAYVAAKYNDALIVQLGASKNPWIPFVEDIYGYRYVEKTLIDQNRFGNSSDWGVNAHGDLGKGLFDYSVSIVDGAGFRNPVRSQQVDIEARANLNWRGFVAAVGGYYGELSNNIQTLPKTARQTASREDALLAYTDGKIRAGVEYFHANNFTVVTRTTPDQAQGWSVFGAYSFFPQWTVFGRYDGVEPSQKLARRERDNFYNIGISYEPAKTVDIALVYKHEDIRNAAPGGYNGGSTRLAPGSNGTLRTSGDFNEVGVYSQFKF